MSILLAGDQSGIPEALYMFRWCSVFLVTFHVRLPELERTTSPGGKEGNPN
jgi:hypothetical protein